MFTVKNEIAKGTAFLVVSSNELESINIIHIINFKTIYLFIPLILLAGPANNSMQLLKSFIKIIKNRSAFSLLKELVSKCL